MSIHWVDGFQLMDLLCNLEFRPLNFMEADSSKTSTKLYSNRMIRSYTGRF